MGSRPSDEVTGGGGAATPNVPSGFTEALLLRVATGTTLPVFVKLLQVKCSSIGVDCFVYKVHYSLSIAPSLYCLINFCAPSFSLAL